jgi:serine/threonine protein kinase
MGVVYRARDTRPDRFERAVALKTVRLPTPRWLESIRREIDALTRIDHPGVVRIVDHGVHDGRPWYAMDLLEGESLRRFGQRLWSRYTSRVPAPLGTTDRVSETEDVANQAKDAAGVGPEAAGPRSSPAGSGEPPRTEYASSHAGTAPAAAGELPSVLRIMRHVCATLAFLHGEGFVNCDLKPENLLLVHGRPVVIDFGLTAHHPGGSGRESLEAQRSMSGTLPYMSPEQIRGELVDARADLYSVGCILYELLTGRPPFSGPPQSVRGQHLSSIPVSPSQVVANIPAKLDQLVLKLLAKDVRDRYGFADEVATALGELIRAPDEPPGYPPSRPYLYRPRLVGRADVLAQLARLREEAAGGSGGFILLSGESGVGKTRLAMELTRLEPGTRMRVVTSEAASVPTQGAGALSSAPLHVIRPVLRAVADRCQEGGPAVTERLLEDRRAVLMPYEPLLAQVPSAERLAPPFPLAHDAARQRLFRYLAETLAAFAHEQPVLWVLDDIIWADELSLEFLKTLKAEYLESTPLLILGTYRSEEVTPAVAALAELPQVKHVPLPRLGADAVSSMISDMLALPERRSEFVDFVARQGEGNPFFVTEHVRAAVTGGVLFRDQHNAWQLRNDDGLTAPSYESIPLPTSLRALIDNRLRSLTPAARDLGQAAAVIGRETELETLHAVADLVDDVTRRALDELLRRQVLEQPEPGRVCFIHDKLREAAYAEAPVERLATLHQRAARSLEKRWGDDPDPSRWATLGHHFAAGHLPKPAARYLQLAADHSRTNYSNGDAIRLYRDAIAQIDIVLSQERQLDRSSDLGPLSAELPKPFATVRAELNEVLGDVLALTGGREEARAAYDDAQRAAATTGVVTRARIYRKLGKTWETEHRHDEAMRLYSLGRDALGPSAPPGAPELDEWIQIHIDQVWVYYWLGRVPEMTRTISDLQPIIERHGAPAQRSRFLQSRMQLNMRRDRYLVNEETLSFARSAVEALAADSSQSGLPMAQFNYGFALVFHQSIDAAKRALLAALDLAKRAGDTAQQARCLTYLTLAFRMAHQVADTREHAQRSAAVAAAAGMNDYYAAARANQAWVALHEKSFDAARDLAREAMDIWGWPPVVHYNYPFQWMALLPLLRVALSRDATDEAAVCAESLLSPTQQPLPGAAADALGLALRLRDRNADSRKALELALRTLEGTVHR